MLDSEVLKERRAIEILGNWLPVDMVWYCRRLESLSPLLQEPHILQLFGLFVQLVSHKRMTGETFVHNGTLQHLSKK